MPLSTIKQKTSATWLTIVGAVVITFTIFVNEITRVNNAISASTLCTHAALLAAITDGH